MAPVTNLQDTFLNHLRRNKVLVTVFLVNGVKLQGMVSWFDQYSVLLRRGANVQLVYKHAVSTIMPGEPITLYEKSGRSQSDDGDPEEDAPADETKDPISLSSNISTPAITEARTPVSQEEKEKKMNPPSPEDCLPQKGVSKEKE